jgi:hypothetical protein
VDDGSALKRTYSAEKRCWDGGVSRGKEWGCCCWLIELGWVVVEIVGIEI